MPGPIIQTKVYVPWRRGATVTRSRLSDRLSRVLDARLTLISAPPGFGKTTLLASWLASTPQPDRLTGWLSLDQSDNDPTGFWGYVVAALQTAAPAGGFDSFLQAEATQSSSDVLVGALVNVLNALPNDLLLVLDDYHVIENRTIHDAMGVLLDRLPPHVHLVIASRTDPPLALARLRARGALVEIRAADLRFTRDEAAAYFNDVMGLDLAAGQLAVLEERTEGWIAALQLAALSMQGRDDIAEFVNSFAGDDRYIVDYLVEEVLERQPEPVREFLLRTSVLNRLTGPLCDAVTDQGGGNAMLEALDRANLFLVALDDRRQWYRYHHLFADVLRAHLANQQPARLPELHRRACAWYERNAERPEAISHALAAHDFAHAADLVEQVAPAVARAKQDVTLRGWLDALPNELLRNRPVLSNVYAGILLSSGELEGVEQRLRDAERWLTPVQRSDAMVVVNEDEFRTLPGSVAIHRAGYALARGNLGESVTHARRALDLAPEDDHLTRGGANALIGLAAWANGDLETAYRSYAEGMAGVQRGGHLSGTVGRAVTLADIRVAQGRLREALRIYEQALQVATQQGRTVVRGTADMYVGMSELQRERNELDAASRSLLTSQQLGEQSGFAQNRYRWRVAMARLHEARGDLDSALDLLGEAQPAFMIDLSPNLRPIAAVRARVLIRQGRIDEALEWAQQGLSVHDELSYVHEYEHITLARLLLASGSGLQASRLLERLLQAAEEGGRTGSAIETLVLQALAYHKRGEMQAALVPLERALKLAEPEGYVRVFVDEGPPMAELLRACGRGGSGPAYVRRLLAHSGTAEGGPRLRQNVIEPLSERELEVLRLLATDLDGPEIASQLMVSLNTMRTHTKSIYTKLAVNSRRAAVRRAEELELLSRTAAR